MNRSKPAYDIALTFMQKIISQAAAGTLTQLPTVGECAQQAGVARGTMLAAVRELKSSGIIDARPRRGMVVGTITLSSNPSVSATAYLPRVDELIRRLEKDIIDGFFKKDQMIPSIKELSARYGTSFAILKKAIHTVQDKGLLMPYKRGFKIACQNPGISHNRVLVYALGDNQGNILHLTQRITDQLADFERIAKELDLHVEVVICYYDGAELKYDKQIGLRNKTHVIGAIIMKLGLNPEPLMVLVDLVAAQGNPVVVFDEVGELTGAVPFRKHSQVRILSSTDELTIGRTAGSYLLGCGYRTCAYFMDENHSHWTLPRFQGIEKAFSEVGLHGAARKFIIKHTVSRSDSIDQYPPIINKHVGNLIDDMKALLPTGFRINSRYHLMDEIHRRTWLEKLGSDSQGPFQEALDTPNITAWVGENDEMALECLRFLTAKKMDVPGKIGVLGFDNTIIGLTNRISSFSFNPTTTARVAFEFIVRPRSLLLDQYQKDGVFVIPGYVVQRATTRDV